jgi:hypothetical protein
MVKETYRNVQDGVRKRAGALRLHSLLVQDSLRKDLPKHQKPFFGALALPGNFRLLKNGDFDLQKLIEPTNGNRYRLYSSFLYSMLKNEMGRQILGGVSPSLYEPGFMGWNSAIHTLLSNPEFFTSFVKNTELSQQAVNPEAVPAIGIVINRLFQADQPLRIFDFGCGQNLDLPALQTKETMIRNRFKPPEELSSFDRAVNVVEAVGVDKNEASDIEWTKICTTQHYKDRGMIGDKVAILDELVGIRDAAKNVRFLKQSVTDFVPENPADVVMTKWMRYQTPDDSLGTINQAVLNSLREGGYWISVGEEEKLRDRQAGRRYDFKTDQIWAWQKRGQELIPLSSGPLMTISYGRIVDFDKAFFSQLAQTSSK